MLKKALTAIFVCSILLALGVGLFALPGTAAVPTYQMSEAYLNSQFYRNFAAISLSGDQVTDLLAIALSQLGYHEGDSEEDLGGGNLSGSRDFVEYNVLYGKLDNNQGNGESYGYYWCASFVNWCLRQAGVNKEASCGSYVSCWKWLESFRSAGRYSPKEDYRPKAGDLIFFKDEDTFVSAGHIGLVLYTEGPRVYTIEGNTSNGSSFSKDGNYVATKSYSLDSPYIVGYGTPDYTEKAELKKPDYSGKRQSSGQYISKVALTCFSSPDLEGEGKTVPAHTVFQVKEVYADFAKILFEFEGQAKEAYTVLRGNAIQLEADQATYGLFFKDGEEADLLPPQFLTENSQTRISTERPVRKDAGFRGWSREKDGSGELFEPGADFQMAGADQTLYAVFDETFYLITFKDPNGHVIAQKYGYYGDSFEIPVPENIPDGHTFFGWDREPETVIKGDAVYTAVYQPEETTDTIEGETQAVTTPDGGCRAVLSFSPAILALVPILLSRRKGEI